jgi:hypothetical protein
MKPMTGHLPRVLSALLIPLSLTFATGFGTSAVAAGQPLVVIVGASVPMKDISTALLRRAFLGEVAEYASGKRLIPINQPPDNPPRSQFDKAILGLNPTEVGRFWVDRRIRDQSSQPKSVPSPEIALRVVMSVPGAITYVTPDMLNEKVRALTIDGKSHDQAGYALTP